MIHSILITRCIIERPIFLIFIRPLLSLHGPVLRHISIVFDINAYKKPSLCVTAEHSVCFAIHKM